MQFECLEARRLLSAYPLTPPQVIDACGINQISFTGPWGTVHGDGAGQTIAIIDGGDDPYLVDSTDPGFANSDLGVFDAQYSLNNNPNFSFTVVGETGAPGSHPTASSFPHGAISSAKQSHNTVTIETSSTTLGLSTGSYVLIAGVGVTGYDGLYTVTSVSGTPSGTTIQYMDYNGPNADGSGLAASAGGVVGNDPVDPSETTQDVEWAHAIAPGAKIVLVELSGGDGTGAPVNPDIVNAITKAVPQVNASVVSMSLGWGEYPGENGTSNSLFDDGIFTAAGVAYVASSGDNGVPAYYPSSSPNVLATGATNLYLSPPAIETATESVTNNPLTNDIVTITIPPTEPTDGFIKGELVTIAGVSDSHYDGGPFTILTTPTDHTFTYQDTNYSNMRASGGGSASIGAETAWNNPQPPATGSEYNWGGSGGGPSAYEPQPTYQSLVVPTTMSNSGAARTTPDVSFVGGIPTPISTYDTADGDWLDGGGGTSLSAPCWAGLIAIADQGRAIGRANGLNLPPLETVDSGAPQSLQTLLYNLPSTDFNDITVGYNGTFAGPGYDLVTGLGSPVANLLVPALAGESASFASTSPDTPAGQAFVLKEVGANVVITDNGTQLLPLVPVGSTSPVAISGGDASGAISLTIDYSGGQFTVPVDFNGGSGGGAHTLNIEDANTSFNDEIETPSSTTGGTIQFDGNPLIDYLNVTNVDDTVPVNVLATFNGANYGDTINLADAAGLVNAFQATQLSSGDGDFATIDFANKTHVTVPDAGVDAFNIDMTNVAAKLLTLTVDATGGTGGDTFDVQATAVTTYLYGGGAKDYFYVHSDAGVDYPNVAGINGTVNLVGGSGAGNRLIVSDFGDTTADAVTVTSSSIGVTFTGGATATIDYSTALGGSFTNGGINDGVLVIGPATAGSTFDVQSTLGGGTTTRIDGGNGSNVFTTGGAGAAITSLTLTGGTGSNQYIFEPSTTPLAAKYTINQPAPAGAAVDTVDFSADPPALAADWIRPSGSVTATSLCSDLDVGTVMVGAALQQENIAYGRNIDPYLDLSGVPAEALPATPFTFRYVDVGTKMTRVSSVAWGDGTSTDPVATVVTDMGLQGIATLVHPYATMRTYTLAFSVANTSTLATKPATVTIVSAMLAPDPQAPGQTGLFVGTSAALNNILLTQSPGGSVSVFLTSPPYYGVFTPSAGGHLYVYATTGSNSVTIGRTVTHDSVVYATGSGNDTIVDDGSGNDCLYGGGSDNTIRAGSGSDVLVGGGLMSFLYGGPGRDVLIGGLGQSFLYGGRGDDLMIAGTTAYDANDAALTAILNEWASGDSFATRMGRLDGAIGGGANGAYLLTAGAGGTVHANGVRNYLFAGSGQNWFFANPGAGLHNDIVVKKPSDIVTLI
jgi:hypothetical protein